MKEANPQGPEDVELPPSVEAARAAVAWIDRNGITPGEGHRRSEIIRRFARTHVCEHPAPEVSTSAEPEFWWSRSAAIEDGFGLVSRNGLIERHHRDRDRFCVHGAIGWQVVDELPSDAVRLRADAPAPLAAGDEVSSARELERRAVEGTIVQDAAEDVGLRGGDVGVERWGIVARNDLVDATWFDYPVVVRYVPEGAQ